MRQPPGMGNLMKQAQKMQAEMAKVQQELTEETVEASTGGGMVTVIVGFNENTSPEVKSVKIEKDAVDPEDVDMLQDLVLTATNEALRQAQELAASKMARVTGGMNLPGLM